MRWVYHAAPLLSEMTVKLRIAAKPSAKKSALLRFVQLPGRDGAMDRALEVAIAAPPVEGRANEELVRVLSKALGLKKKDVTVVAGETGRTKIVEIEGLDAAELESRLGALLSAERS
jgi:uncharacterized protein (TIGR00251 family)